MSKTDPSLAGKLRAAPTYQAALAGQWSAPGMPNTPGFRAEQLRAAARQDGIDIPSGYAFDAAKGAFEDANADHWYSDPRVWGPIAVGAATGIGALTAAPAAGASAVGASAAAGPLGSSLPAAIGTQGVSAGVGAASSAGVFGMNPVTAAILGGQTFMDYLGKRSQDKATDKALQAQLQSSRDALALQKTVYDQTRSDLQPFTLAGTDAVKRLTAAGSGPKPAAPGVMPSFTLASMPSSGFAQSPAAAKQSGGMVMLKAPDGTTQAVPASQVAHYLSRGAVRVA